MLGVRCSRGLDSEQGVGWAERTDHEDLGETHTYTHTQRDRERTTEMGRGRGRQTETE